MRTCAFLGLLLAALAPATAVSQPGTPMDAQALLKVRCIEQAERVLRSGTLEEADITLGAMKTTCPAEEYNAAQANYRKLIDHIILTKDISGQERPSMDMGAVGGTATASATGPFSAEECQHRVALRDSSEVVQLWMDAQRKLAVYRDVQNQLRALQTELQRTRSTAEFLAWAGGAAHTLKILSDTIWTAGSFLPSELAKSTTIKIIKHWKDAAKIAEASNEGEVANQLFLFAVKKSGDIGASLIGIKQFVDNNKAFVQHLTDVNSLRISLNNQFAAAQKDLDAINRYVDKMDELVRGMKNEKDQTDQYCGRSFAPKAIPTLGAIDCSVLKNPDASRKLLTDNQDAWFNLTRTCTN